MKQHLIFNSVLLLCLIFSSMFLNAAPEDSIKNDSTQNEVEKAFSDKIFVYSIESEIFPAAWRKTKRAVEKAEEENCSHIILKLNTYGGLVSVADSIRTKLMESKPTSIVFIDNNAASAGALISIACDSIYMSKGAQIGAATVVDQSGEKLMDKYQSYMRATMRSTAEAQNRDPRIAEAMVDESVEIEGIIEKDKILTFTTSEAIKHNYCEGKFNSIDEIITHLGLEDSEVIKYETNLTEKIISFLLNPAVSSILMMMIFGGIWFELQTPGVGFPILAALIGAILYFAPNYIEGLAANWEIFLFIAGLILLAIEFVAIPGFGFLGLLGLIFIVSGLTLSLLQNDFFDFTYTPPIKALQALISVVGPLFILMLLMIFFGQNILDIKAFKRIALQTTQDASEGYTVENTEYKEYINQTGIAYTVLRPSGKVKIGDKILDAITDGEWIEQGSKIKVDNYHGSYLNVSLVA